MTIPAHSGVNSGKFDLDLNHKYLLMRRTKIVATIGPSSSSPEKLRRLIAHGLDVARINFSHGKPEDHLKTIRLIRTISGELRKPVAILGDLCGPKIRVGEFVNGSVTLTDGARVIITQKSVLGNEKLIPSQYKNLVREVSPGSTILLDDGNLELKVLKKYSDRVEARVEHGGVLKNKKGMNLPDTQLHIAALTAKDKKDVLYCIQGGVDYIALSFVRKPADIRDLKTWLKRHNSDIPVIAKIEMPEALNNIEGIMELADGIMVARGDLGVELPAKKVPIIQNKLIRIANAVNKPVIVATQMLESMINHSRPTRAEVTDVTAAFLAGADAVMMSAETASGAYPLEAFAAMDSILREAEAYQFFSLGGKFSAARDESVNGLADAIGNATAQLSHDLKVHCILVFTTTGFTARAISADKPAAPVIALARSATIARRLHLLWGVYPLLVPKSANTRASLAFGEQTIKTMGLAKKGDYLIMISGLKDMGPVDTAIMLHKVA